MLYRHDEPRLEVVTQERPWSFDGDGALSRLVSEAQRIRLAHLFDPLLAVHTSVVDPQPHQITGVYKAMLPRQPLRFRTRRQTPLRDQVDLVGARTRAASERRDRLSRQKRPQERFLVGARLLVTRTLVLAQPILAALRARGVSNAPIFCRFWAVFTHYVLLWHVMGISNADAQREWRKRHPQKAAARLDAFKEKKAQGKAKKTGTTECDHDDRGVRVHLVYCGKCRQLISFSPIERVIEESHAEWLSRRSELDERE